MRVQVIAVSALHSAERTADLTIRFYNDTNAVLATETLIVPVDGLSEQEVRDRINDQLEKKIQLQQVMPTQAQVEAIAVNVQVMLPG